MDVTGRLLRFAAGRPHPFLVAAPGGTAVRLAVERECRRRGWPLASSPAEADLLVTCGTVGAGLAGPLGRVWEQMPAPRARVRCQRTDDVVSALHDGRARLADVAEQRAGVSARVAERGTGSGAEREETGDPAGGNHHGDNHGESHGGDHGGGHGGGHGEHGGHGGMMSMPGGLDMAGRAADRDGLRLDVLHVPLGPLLPDWPPGLVVHTVLQGDILQRARPRFVAGEAAPSTPFWDEPWLRERRGEAVPRSEAARRRAAAYLDSVGRLLSVAGWADAALAAGRLRDDTLAGVAGAVLAARFGRFARRVRRSRLLRWMTRGLGVLDAEAASAHGISGPALRAGGDVTSRLLRWLEECADALTGVDDERPLGSYTRAEIDLDREREGPRGRLDGDARPSRALLDALPALLQGTELARARLVVASLDPDPDELAGVPAVAEVAGD